MQGKTEYTFETDRFEEQMNEWMSNINLIEDANFT